MSQITKPQSLACLAVFDTAELAEAIFLELPMRGLLVNVQRTCKQWKAVLDGSRKLQQAMFFEPIADQALHPDTPHELAETRPAAHPLVIGPYLNPRADKYKYSQLDVLWRLNASWRRQLVSQPPIARADVLNSRHGDYAAGVSKVVKAGAVGVTWGDMFVAGFTRPDEAIITGLTHWRLFSLAEGPTYTDIAV